MKKKKKAKPAKAKKKATPKKANAPKRAKAKTKGTTKKRKYCLYSHCRAEPSAHGYCRLHYISVWKTLQLNNRIKAEKKLNSWVDRLAKKYPKDYMEKIKEGLGDEEKFQQTLESIGSPGSDSDEEGTEKEFLEKLSRDLKIGD